MAQASAADGAWDLLAPASGRFGRTAVHDPVRDRIIVFGGKSSAGKYLADLWVQTLNGTPHWTQLFPSGAAPSARYEHAAVYDRVRDRMLLFGGFDGTAHNDVWALSLGATPVWTQLAPLGPAPAPRRFHSMIYDPVRDRVLVFGGLAGSANLNDAWSLSLGATPAWTPIAPGGMPPSARRGASVVYDTALDRLIVFGGLDAAGYRDDTWVLSLSGTLEWSPLAPSGLAPAARAYHAAAYDAVADRMIVFGGLYTDARADAWSLSLSPTPLWSSLTPSGGPPAAREIFSMILDPARQQLVCFGGTDGFATLSDTWSLGLSASPAWSVLIPWVLLPTVTSGHTAILDPVRKRMIEFGGTPFSCCLPLLNEVWSLSLGPSPFWTQLVIAGTPPAGRIAHSAIYDPVRDRMIVYGGYPNADELWSLSLSAVPTWSRLSAAGTLPAGRYGHTAIYDAAPDRMIVFGGFVGSTKTNDVFALALAGPPTWAALSPTGTPPQARGLHTAIRDPRLDRMVIFGGEGAIDALLNDTWTLSLAGTPAWSQLTPSGTLPDGRWDATAVYDPDREWMIVFGGATAPTGQVTRVNDTQALAWAPTLDAPPRAGSTSDRLSSPFPNPARREVWVDFELAHAGRATLRIYDVAGRVVSTLCHASRPAGVQRLRWDGTATGGPHARPGLYICELRTARERLTRRIALTE